MIPARDGAVGGVVGPGVAGHGVGHDGDAPGRSPDGRSSPLSPAVGATAISGCIFLIGFLPILLSNSSFQFFPFENAGVSQPGSSRLPGNAGR